MDNEKEEGLDQSYLDDVLNSLYDFGDGPSRRKSKSQKKKRKRSAQEGEEAGGDDDCVLEEAQPQNGTGTCSDGTKAESDDEPHPPGVEVVTFQDPMKKVMKNKTPVVPVGSPEIKEKSKTKEKQNPESLEEISLEKARLEVHRFGITGYRKEQQRMFEQDRAIMLGAKPPKKEYVNYRLYQQMSKDKKQKAREEVNTDLKKKKKSKPRDVKRKSTSGASAPMGQVGRFKNGMLVLSSKEIQNIKTSRVRK